MKAINYEDSITTLLSRTTKIFDPQFLDRKNYFLFSNKFNNLDQISFAGTLLAYSLQHENEFQIFETENQTISTRRV